MHRASSWPLDSEFNLSQAQAAERFVRFYDRSNGSLCKAIDIYNAENNHPNNVKVVVNIKETGSENGVLATPDFTNEFSFQDIEIITDNTEPNRPTEPDFIINPGNNVIDATVIVADNTAVGSVEVYDITDGGETPLINFPTK